MKVVIVVVKEYLGAGSFGEEGDKLVHVAQAEEGVFREGETQRRRIKVVVVVVKQEEQYK